MGVMMPESDFYRLYERIRKAGLLNIIFETIPSYLRRLYDVIVSVKKGRGPHGDDILNAQE